MFIAAALGQVLTAAALRLMSLPTFRSRSVRARAVAQWAVAGAEDEVVWAIDSSGRRLGRLSTCLVRALLAEILLTSPDRPLSVTIGARRTAEGVPEAHAWVTVDGRIVVGRPSKPFVPIVEWGGGAMGSSDRPGPAAVAGRVPIDARS